MSEVKTDSVVNVSGDSDSGIDLSTNDVVAIKTADTERMRITSNGSVGIGASTVDRQLHIEGNRTNSYSSTDFDNTYNLMKIENPNTSTGAATGMQFLVGSNGSAAISVTRVGDGQADMCFGTRGGGSRKERMRIDSGGNVMFNQNSTTSPGLSNTTPGAVISDSGRIFSSVDGAWSSFNRNSDNGDVMHFRRSGTLVGSISVTTSSTAFNTSSDHRLKENVADMTGAIARVKQLAPKRFNFIADPDDTTVDGFLAHEAQAVVPEAVSGTHNEVDDDGNAVMQGIDQSKLVPLLTGALQEAIAKIEALEARVTALENA